MEFIESPLFTKLIETYLSVEEYAAFQWHLALHPEAGSLIVGSGGLRKIRWGAKGQGKRGGLRTIYYYQATSSQIWLLTAYTKGAHDTLPPALLKRIKETLLS